MTDVEVNIPCPRCRKPFPVSLSTIGQGRSASCPACGTPVTFAGSDAAGVQRAIDQLQGQMGDGAVKVKVRVRTRSKRPWWKFWSAD